MNKVVKGATYRFTVITNSLIRLEQSDNGCFEDQPTTAILHRDFKKNLDVRIIKKRNNHLVEIITDAFHLYYDGGSFSPDTLYADIKSAQALHVSRWHFNSKNAEGTNNLKGTARTLDRADGAIPLADGIMSRDGYSYLDDSSSFIYNKDTDSYYPRKENIIDGYLFTYGHNYQKELQDFYRLSGSTPLIPRFALGNWWSRYHPYNQKEYQKLVENFEQRKIPISVSVIDTDWHRESDVPAKYGSPWTGFSWNKKLFPDHLKFLSWLHQHYKHVGVNIHPADGIRAFENQYSAVAKDMDLDTESEEPAAFDLENPIFRNAYFKDVLHPLEKDGIDFWWIDWQQGFSLSKKKLDPLWLLNHYQYEDIAKRKPNQAIILSRYAGVGSHRYPLGFSGDTVISWKSLAFQPYFTSTAANIGYTWWSHDIGGHMMGKSDGELATRWLQFGVFSPITRLHSSNNIFSGKEPWNFRVDYKQAQEYFLRLRAKLVPYIDTANYQTHQNGIPIVKPLYYDYPELDAAYDYKDEYFFGSQMLVSPITQAHDEVTQTAYSNTWLPDGEWVDYFNHLLYQGNTTIKTYRDCNRIPVFVKKGSLIITSPNYMAAVDQLPEVLRVEIFPGKDCQYTLIEHVADKIARTTFIWHDKKRELTWQVDDPAKIIPATRKITQEAIHYDKDDIISEAYHRLQIAKMDFDLKQKLYLAFVAKDYQYGSFINLLNEYTSGDLHDSLSEMAYIREAYDE